MDAGFGRGGGKRGTLVVQSDESFPSGDQAVKYFLHPGLSLFVRGLKKAVNTGDFEGLSISKFFSKNSCKVFGVCYCVRPFAVDREAGAAKAD